MATDMSIFARIAAALDGLLDEMVATGELPAGLNRSAVTVEPPRDAARRLAAAFEVATVEGFGSFAEAEIAAAAMAVDYVRTTQAGGALPRLSPPAPREPRAARAFCAAPGSWSILGARCAHEAGGRAQSVCPRHRHPLPGDRQRRPVP